MRILFIAPLPPPIHGQSLASDIFLKSIQASHKLLVVNTAKKKSKNLLYKIVRNFEVGGMFLKIIKYYPKADVIYLTISESIFGNVKDLVIYLLCFNKLSQMTIHLHGGAGMIEIMKDKNSWLARINGFFIRKMKNVIILGSSHLPVFQDVIQSSSIHIVPNFAEDYLFLEEQEILFKFNVIQQINLLFLSNLLPGKGYLELINAYLELPEPIKSRLNINFAGAFASDEFKAEFLEKIKGQENVHYHGVVKGKQKKDLFEKSHIFCLPTYYPYEGQPISILEAYASGCAVITTNHSGIKDVFTNKKNGYEVEKRSVESIREVLAQVVEEPEILKVIALFNHRVAQEKYRTSIYTGSLKRIIQL